MTPYRHIPTGNIFFRVPDMQAMKIRLVSGDIVEALPMKLAQDGMDAIDMIPLSELDEIRFAIYDPASRPD